MMRPTTRSRRSRRATMYRGPTGSRSTIILVLVVVVGVAPVRDAGAGPGLLLEVLLLLILVFVTLRLGVLRLGFLGLRLGLG